MDLDDEIERWILPDDSGSPALGRALVEGALEDVASIDDIVLATSELVTNAVEHGEGPVELTLIRSKGAVRIEAASAFAGREPAPRRAGHEDSGGRGLTLVETLATRWGWERQSDVLRVWAEFDPV